MNKPLVHTFRGKKYRIKWRKLRAIKGESGKSYNRLGYCENPKLPKPSMCIDPNLCEHATLRTIIDESIHACFFDLGNDEVGEAARDIAKFLQKIGIKIVVAKRKKAR